VPYLSFQQATELFREYNSAEETPFDLNIQHLEFIILDHIPLSPMEAALMLDVIIPDVLAGARSDGRDVTALRNIRSMLMTCQSSDPST